MNEDDTFEMLRKPPFMAVYHNVETAICEYLLGKGRNRDLNSVIDVINKVVTDNHWTIEDYKAMVRNM
jgi:hypothetical protein